VKENRAQRLEAIIRSYGGRATLAQLIEATKQDGGLAYKLTAAVSEARDMLRLSNPPQTIVCYKGKTPSQNLYVIEPYLELFHGERAA